MISHLSRRRILILINDLVYKAGRGRLSSLSAAIRQGPPRTGEGGEGDRKWNTAGRKQWRRALDRLIIGNDKRAT